MFFAKLEKFGHHGLRPAFTRMLNDQGDARRGVFRSSKHERCRLFTCIIHVCNDDDAIFTKEAGTQELGELRARDISRANCGDGEFIAGGRVLADTFDDGMAVTVGEEIFCSDDDVYGCGRAGSLCRVECGA